MNQAQLDSDARHSHTLNALEVSRGEAPKLVHTPEQATTSSATHKVLYIGPRAIWTDFPDIVRAWHASKRSAYDRTKDVPVASRDLPSSYSTTKECIVVGREETLDGRFFQNVLLPSQCAVWTITGTPDVWCGDSRTCTPAPNRPPLANLEPDVVLFNQYQTRSSGLPDARAVGEVKVFWVDAHDIGRAMDVMQDNNRSTSFNRLVGQICEYMYEYGVKYGFLTNYEQTTFIRQVCIATLYKMARELSR